MTVKEFLTTTAPSTKITITDFNHKTMCIVTGFYNEEEELYVYNYEYHRYCRDTVLDNEIQTLVPHENEIIVICKS